MTMTNYTHAPTVTNSSAFHAQPNASEINQSVKFISIFVMFAALSHAVCLDNALFLLLIFANAFCFHALSWFIDA